MPTDVFTDPWADAWCREVNASEPYRQAAEAWEGALVLVMAADPGDGLAEVRAVFADLRRGGCLGARSATAADLASAPFVLSAPPAIWRGLLRGEIQPLSAVLSGRLKLERGSLTRLLPYASAATELVRAAARIDARFPGDPP